ncbi:MAG: phosphotransferase [Burkholderiaceae bacterium]
MPTGTAQPREAALARWLASLPAGMGLQTDTLRPASDDASFRRYFRIDRAGAGSMIVMDAPPPMEDCRPFVHAAGVLATAGLRVPGIHAADLEQGFLLLDDLGNTTLLAALASADSAATESMYRAAIAALVRMQAASRPGVFAPYDHARLFNELALYPTWYLERQLGVALSTEDRGILEQAFDALIANNLAQPQVFVHRDYHSRNLMVAEDAGAAPGVLDFQDAVFGPITYDLVSLLRDAYVDWPEEVEIDRAARYWEAARAAGLSVATDFGEFYRDLEWMGLQRHLKVLGIFSRLHHRDGKDRYLADCPRVLGYVLRTVGRYRELAPLARLIDRFEGRRVSVGHTF